LGIDTLIANILVVTVELWKELLRDMMLIVLDSVEQTFVGGNVQATEPEARHTSRVHGPCSRTGRGHELNGGS